MKRTKEQVYLKLSQCNDTSSVEPSEALLLLLDESHRWRRRFFVAVVCASIILLSATSIITFLATGNKCKQHLLHIEQPYSPANEHAEYVSKRLTGDSYSHRLTGNPGIPMDDAWHELLEGTLIRVSGEELEAAGNETSITYNDGGFVAGLGISHSLHCLKRINQLLNSDYYYPNETQDWVALKQHADHCLDSLRQVIMCHADLSLYTLEWTPHSRVKPAVRAPAPRMCVNYGKLQAWMLSRAAQVERMEGPSDPV